MKTTRDRPTGFWMAAALLVLTAFSGLFCLKSWYMRWFVVVFAAQVALYALAAWGLLSGRLRAGLTERQSLAAILVVAAVLRGIALFSPQTLSTDTFRYVWDGRVQAAGINPYRYVPADPALAELRDPRIYPSINRATYAHTIYPPAAQLVFLAAERVSDSILGMKLAMVVFDSVSIACLIALLRHVGLPVTRVLIYAWHPLPIWEFAGTGHVDAAAIGLLLLAFVAVSRRAPFWTGVALAAATLVKYYPLVAAPGLYGRWDWRMPLAFVTTLSLLYLPYLGVGIGVFGFLSGYTQEEGMRSGSGIFLLWLLGAGGSASPRLAVGYFAAAAAVMASLSLWLQFRRPADAKARLAGSFALASVFTVLLSPHDPWYFTWLVPFLCFRWVWANLWLTGACVFMYVSEYPIGWRTQAILYVPFLVLLCVQHFTQPRPSSPENLDAGHATPR